MQLHPLQLHVLQRDPPPRRPSGAQQLQPSTASGAHLCPHAQPHLSRTPTRARALAAPNQRIQAVPSRFASGQPVASTCAAQPHSSLSTRAILSSVAHHHGSNGSHTCPRERAPVRRETHSRTCSRVREHWHCMHVRTRSGVSLSWHAVICHPASLTRRTARPVRCACCMQLTDYSAYAAQIAWWLAFFPPEQFLILTNDDLRDPRRRVRVRRPCSPSSPAPLLIAVPVRTPCHSRTQQ